MTRLLVSTVRRGTPPTDASGHLYWIDLEERRVIQRSTIVEPAYKTQDPNPRGGMRGSKGISVLPNRISIANSSMVFHYSPEWDFLGLNTHRLCSYIHDILAVDDQLWVCSAGTDLVARFDSSGKLNRYFDLRTPSAALQALNWNPPVLVRPQSIHPSGIDFRNPSTHDHMAYDNAHVNSLAFHSNGDMLVSLGFIIGQDFTRFLRIKTWLMRSGLWNYILAANRGVSRILNNRPKNTDNTLVLRPAKASSAIIRITPNGERTLVLELPGMTSPSHSLMLLPDETAVYLNTTESSVIRFEPHSCEVLSVMQLPKGFLRGVTLLADHLLLVGNQTQLMAIDINSQKVVSTFQFSTDPVESVYDVKVMPPQYKLPPESFPDHLARLTGCRSPEELIRQFDLEDSVIK